MKRLTLVLLSVLTIVLLIGCDSVQLSGDTSLLVGQKVRVILHKGDDLVPDGITLMDGKGRSYTTGVLEDYQFVSPTEEVFRIPAMIYTGVGKLKINHAGGGSYIVNVTLHRAIAYADQQGSVHVMDLDEPTRQLQQISFGQQTEAIGTSDVSYAFPMYSTNVGQVAVISLESGVPEAIHVEALKLSAQQQLMVYDVALNWANKWAFAATNQGIVKLEPSGDGLKWDSFELSGRAVRVLVDASGESVYVMALMSENGQVVPYISNYSDDAVWRSLTSLPSSGDIIDAAILYPSLFIIVKASDQRHVYYYDLTIEGAQPSDISSMLTDGESSCADPSAIRIGGDSSSPWAAILCGSKVYLLKSESGGTVSTTAISLNGKVGNAISLGERAKVYVLLNDGEIGYIDTSSQNPQFVHVSDSEIRVSNIWVQH